MSRFRVVRSVHISAYAYYDGSSFLLTI